MSKTYKILAEKYNQIYENDASAGIEKLAKEFKLISFFRHITLTPATSNETDIDSILDTWYEIADQDVTDERDHDLGHVDYQPHPEEIYDYILNTIDDAFDAPAADYTAGIDINDVKARIEKWYDKRDPYIN
jgi:hypothetical protein